MERIGDFREATLGLPDAREAQRCLSCGRCTLCDTCLVYCPEGIIRREEGGYLIDLDYCKGCGICATECPRGAIVMVQP
jgi:2-oxoacid:acceptor oxidoreductase delta subunit (pyruvate/2-ketoisovalerate family)